MEAIKAEQSTSPKEAAPIEGNNESLESTSTDSEDNSAAEYDDDIREIRTSDDVDEPDPEDPDLEPVEQSDPDTIEGDEDLEEE